MRSHHEVKIEANYSLAKIKYHQWLDAEVCRLEKQLINHPVFTQYVKALAEKYKDSSVENTEDEGSYNYLGDEFLLNMKHVLTQILGKQKWQAVQLAIYPKWDFHPGKKKVSPNKKAQWVNEYFQFFLDHDVTLFNVELFNLELIKLSIDETYRIFCHFLDTQSKDQNSAPYNTLKSYAEKLTKHYKNKVNLIQGFTEYLNVIKHLLTGPLGFDKKAAKFFLIKLNSNPFVKILLNKSPKLSDRKFEVGKELTKEYYSTLEKKPVWLYESANSFNSPYPLIPQKPLPKPVVNDLTDYSNLSWEIIKEIISDPVYSKLENMPTLRKINDEHAFKAVLNLVINENHLTEKSILLHIQRYLQNKNLNSAQCIVKAHHRFFANPSAALIQIKSLLERDWRNQGVGLFGCKKPTGIAKMQDFLKKNENSALSNREKLSALAKIIKDRPNKDKNRSRLTASLYNLILELEDGSCHDETLEKLKGFAQYHHVRCLNLTSQTQGTIKSVYNISF